MEGGAWNSDVFETGRDGQKARAGAGARAPPAHGRAAAMEAGTTPALYNPTPMGEGKDSRKIGVATVTLRSLMFVFTLIAVGLMAAAKQNVTTTVTAANQDYYAWFSSSVSVKFTAVHAFVGLLSVAIIVCFYTLVQLVLCVMQVLSTGTFIASATTGGSLLTFIFDSVLAYALIGAAAAAADSRAVLKERGECASLSKFCGTTGASIAVAIIAFIMLAACAALFPLRLYKMSLSR